jgi:hypothetical protein
MSSSQKMLVPGIKEYYHLEQLIQKALNLPIASVILAFTDETIALDLSPAQKMSYVAMNHPALYELSRFFDKHLTKLENILRKVSKQQPDEEKRAFIVDSYIKQLNAIHAAIDPEEVRSRLSIQLNADEFYEHTYFGTHKLRVRKPILWDQLSVQKLKEKWLFEEYWEFVENLITHIEDVVSEFHHGFPKNADKQLPRTLFHKNTPKSLKEIIKDWPAFITICDYYSEPRIINRKLKPIEAQLICYDTEVNNYKWQGTISSKLPLLGEFISQLMQDEIFDGSVHTKKTIMSGFLKFFQLPADEQRARDLGKMYLNRDNLYRGSFINIKILAQEWQAQKWKLGS